MVATSKTHLAAGVWPKAAPHARSSPAPNNANRFGCMVILSLRLLPLVSCPCARVSYALPKCSGFLRAAQVQRDNSAGQVLTVELHRAEQRLTIRRRTKGDWQWWCQGAPEQKNSVLKWKSGVALRVLSGELKRYEPRGYEPSLAVGFGKLRLDDPSPMAYPKCTALPGTNDEVTVEVAIRL